MNIKWDRCRHDMEGQEDSVRNWTDKQSRTTEKERSYSLKGRRESHNTSQLKGNMLQNVILETCEALLDIAELRILFGETS
jgi:hypothetical protein